MTVLLEQPRSADDLYLARAADIEDVSVLRPIMTGDVFRGIKIPGVDEQPGDDEELAIVVSHPCSMRNGAALKTHIQATRVLRCEPVKLDAWPKMYFDRIPLPELTVVIDPDDLSTEDPEADIAVRTEEGSHAALFDLRGRVESNCMQLDQRIACMTEQGVALLHQRMAHYDTRYAPEVDNLIAACGPVFAEVELWEQWNERLIAPNAAKDTTSLQAELARVANIFDAELSKRRPIPNKRNGWYTLRNDLSIPKRHAAARREILKLLNEEAKELQRAGLA